MADRQTMNVSLAPQQERFVRDQVETGRYRTASEVVREGLRLLEQAEHRRRLEEWIYRELGQEAETLPAELKERTQRHFDELIAEALNDVELGRVVDGPAAMQRLRERLEARAR